MSSGTGDVLMLNPYLIEQLHKQREAELERRLAEARLSAQARPSGHAEIAEMRAQVAAALVALAHRIAPSQPAPRTGHAAHVL
jgi:hypothetical protein